MQLPKIFRQELFVPNGTVRARTITELIVERAGPVILKTFVTGIHSFQTDSSNLSCKRSEA